MKRFLIQNFARYVPPIFTVLIILLINRPWNSSPHHNSPWVKGEFSNKSIGGLRLIKNTHCANWYAWFMTGCHSQIFCLKLKTDFGKSRIGLIQCAESFVGREIQFLLLSWMMTFLTSIGFPLCIFMIGFNSRGGWTVTIKHDCVFATKSHWFGTEWIFN